MLKEKAEVILGATYQDDVTKFMGIAAAHIQYYNGMFQVYVVPECENNDKFPDGRYLDYQRLTRIGDKQVIVGGVLPEKCFSMGDEVKDTINGFVGIVTARETHLNKCVSYLVEPKKADGIPDQKNFPWIDIDRLELEKAAVVKTEKRNTGSIRANIPLNTSRKI